VGRLTESGDEEENRENNDEEVMTPDDVAAVYLDYARSVCTVR